MPNQNPDPLMTRAQAATYIGMAPQTLAKWACTGRYDLKPIKVGSHAVRYRRSVLDQFLEEYMPQNPF